MWTFPPRREIERLRLKQTRHQTQSQQSLSIEILEDRISPTIALNADSWTCLGPAPIANQFSGRVMALAPDPTDANVI
jgi:hypothetical protein